MIAMPQRRTGPTVMFALLARDLACAADERVTPVDAAPSRPVQVDSPPDTTTPAPTTPTRRRPTSIPIVVW